MNLPTTGHSLRAGKPAGQEIKKSDTAATVLGPIGNFAAFARTSPAWN
jgi:hypothetical protein